MHDITQIDVLNGKFDNFRFIRRTAHLDVKFNLKEKGKD